MSFFLFLFFFVCFLKLQLLFICHGMLKWSICVFNLWIPIVALFTAWCFATCQLRRLSTRRLVFIMWHLFQVQLTVRGTLPHWRFAQDDSFPASSVSLSFRKVVWPTWAFGVGTCVCLFFRVKGQEETHTFKRSFTHLLLSIYLFVFYLVTLSKKLYNGYLD